MLPNGEVYKIMENFLYQPASVIIVDEFEHNKFNMYDEFNCDGCLVRKIWLKE